MRDKNLNDILVRKKHSHSISSLKKDNLCESWGVKMSFVLANFKKFNGKTYHDKSTSIVNQAIIVVF